MNLVTLQAFENELEKIAESTDKDLSFFERHPKKIIGGGLAALGAGAYLLSRGKKGGSSSGFHAVGGARPKPTHAGAKAQGLPGARPLKPKPPAAHQPAPAAAGNPPAKTLTPEEIAAKRAAREKEVAAANRSPHKSKLSIQELRDKGKAAGLPEEEWRAVHHISHLDAALARHKKP